MKYIIFDTNIVVEKNDFFFEKDMRYLLEYNKFDEVHVCIPKIIKQEIIKKYLDNLREYISKYNDIVKKNKTYRFIEKIDSIEIKDLKIKYENKLNETLKKEKIKEIDYPKENSYIDKIMERLSLGKIPFKNEKDSFRDAIIWYTILNFLNEIDIKDEIVFITKNTKDFFDSEQKDLHEELKEDLGNNKKIILYKSIKELREKDSYIKSMEENLKLKNFIVDFKGSINKFELLKIIEKEINIEEKIKDYFDSLELDFLEPNLFYKYPEFDYCDENVQIENIEIDMFNELDGVICANTKNKVFYSILFLEPCYSHLDEELIFEYKVESNIMIEFSIYFKVDNIEERKTLEDIEIKYIEVEKIYLLK